jgi:hypothetical protein
MLEGVTVVARCLQCEQSRTDATLTQHGLDTIEQSLESLAIVGDGKRPLKTPVRHTNDGYVATLRYVDPDDQNVGLD